MKTSPNIHEWTAITRSKLTWTFDEVYKLQSAPEWGRKAISYHQNIYNNPLNLLNIIVIIKHTEKVGLENLIKHSRLKHDQLSLAEKWLPMVVFKEWERVIVWSGGFFFVYKCLLNCRQIYIKGGFRKQKLENLGENW